ncbi:MAG TPA: biopolymer transporter ExbD [Candidatus Eisenbacteria bacterium]|jgi:biopolymer transport protein ExbD
MRRRRYTRVQAGITEPNLTPLIDVCLVLVVILLVATPMALQSGIAVSRAASGGKTGAQVRASRIEISILDETSLTVNRRPVARADLGAVLRTMLAASQTRDVVVRCSDNVTHGTFVSVLDEAKVDGAGRIAVLGR